MGYLSYFLEGRVFFHEHILHIFLMAVKDAQVFFSGYCDFQQLSEAVLCPGLCSRCWRNADSGGAA